MEIQTSNGNFAEVDAHALAIAVFKNEKADEGFLQQLDKQTNGLVKSLLETGELTGKEGETFYVPLAEATTKVKAKRLLLVGVGERGEYRPGSVSQMAGTAARQLRTKNALTIGLVPRYEGEDTEDAVAAAVEGANIGLFEPDKYRTSDREERHVERLVIIAEGMDANRLQQAAERGQIVGQAVNFTRDLANEPGAYMTPTNMAEQAQAVADKFGLEIDVLDHARMEAEGMGALLGVARGSEEPAKMIVLKYTPTATSDSESKTGLLAFVGKGVTFDTGGISLKPGENMEQMKYDMTGGATVIGVMRAVAQLKPRVPVLGVVPAVENMPSGRAVKPGDILTAMTGKTIEVINTDAEGRLILADAIAYARKLGATKIVDLATLTGAVVIALGDVNVAVLGTDQPLIDEVIAAGHEVGEKYWQLPLDREYTKQIKSDIADIKNIGGRKAGTITAAAFLKEFAEGVAWAHLDIAGTAWSDDPKPYRAKGPTGIGVRMLLKMVERAEAANNGS